MSNKPPDAQTPFGGRDTKKSTEQNLRNLEAGTSNCRTKFIDSPPSPLPPSTTSTPPKTLTITTTTTTTTTSDSNNKETPTHRREGNRFKFSSNNHHHHHPNQNQNHNQNQEERERNLRYRQYSELLLNIKYTDVAVEELEFQIMANDNLNETKPLTESNLTRKPKVIPKYDVHRDVLLHDVVIKSTGYSARDKSIPSAIRQCWINWSFLALFTGCLPIIQWLPKYSIRRDVMGDVIAGFTVAIMNIPHGMAYGILAGVTAECGLYMAIFPVIVYMIFGTSRHISIGTFAVISMMTLKVVQTVATEKVVVQSATGGGDGGGAILAEASSENITALQVVTVLALTTGLVHLAMGFLRLGTLAALLSDPLVSGFTTGAAFHVVTSQLKDLLGVTVQTHKGAFKIIYTIIDLVKSVPQTNIAAFIFCLGVICFMTLCNEVLKPYLRKYCRMPLPGELIAVIGGTLISMWLNVEKAYSIRLVGTIPSQLPMPELPRFELIPKVALDSVAIAIVSFSVVMSMGLPFARKHNYEMRANQELFAIGIANCVGGCFSCLPLGCSLSRSVIQEQTGGVTQLASLVSATLILMTVFWAGPFFSALPKCVLAGVIIVALKPLFMQVKDLKKFSKQGKLELFTWIGTFFSVVIIDIDIGLLIGIAISVLSLYIKGVKPYSSLMGVLPEAAAIYVDLSHHRNAIELPEIKIFRYTGSLNFATSRFFLNALNETLGLNEFNKLKKKKKKSKKNNKSKSPKKSEPSTKPPQVQQLNGQQQQQGGGGGEEEAGAGQPQTNGKLTPEQLPLTSNNLSEIITPTSVDEVDNDQSPTLPFRCLVFDFSMLGHIDVAGCHTLTEVMKEMGLNNVRLFFGAPTDRVYDSMVHGMALGEGPFEIFPTLHDAVLYANACVTA